MKIADFGLARSLTNIADNKDSTPILTDYVATRWKVLRTPHSCNSGLISCFTGIEPLRFFWVLQDTHLELIRGQVVVSSENFLEGALPSNQHNFKADNIFQKANFPWHLDHESTWPHNGGEKLGPMSIQHVAKVSWCIHRLRENPRTKILSPCSLHSQSRCLHLFRLQSQRRLQR